MMTTLTDELFAEIADAVRTVSRGRVRRIDGEGFKVYAIPGAVRIDIANKEAVDGQVRVRAGQGHT